MLKQKYTIKPIKYERSVREFVATHHYTQSTPSAVLFAFGLFDQDVLVGVCTFGTFSRHQAATRYHNFLELSRFVLSPVCQKNSASFFMARCLKRIQYLTQYVGVISYADPTEGHTGTIYRAANFEEMGATRKSYHYTYRGVRMHKKQVWRRSRREGISERQYAETYRLVKVEEKEKIIFRYWLRNKKIQGHIYLITNTVNSKQYVGLTTQGIERRFKRHKLDAEKGSKLPLHTAMRQLGIQHFSIQEIASTQNLSELQDLEIKEIHARNTLIPNGYNVLQGFSPVAALIPDEVIEEAYRLRKAGASYELISRRYQISSDYLSNLFWGRVRPHLLERMQQVYGPLDPVKAFSKEQKLLMLDFWAAGESGAEVASKFDCTAEQVHGLVNGKISPKIREEWVALNGPIREPKPTQKILDLAAVKADYLSGMRLQDMASNYGVSQMGSYIKRNLPEIWLTRKEPELPVEFKVSLTDEQIRDIFSLKSHGLKTEVIAKKYGLSASWLNKVLRGDKRPEYAARAKEMGIAGAVKFTGGGRKSLCRIEGEGICFISGAQAAQYLQVSVPAVFKALRTSKPCRGMRLIKR